MRMIFTLTEKQQKKINEKQISSYAEYKTALEEYELRQWSLYGKIFTGFHNDQRSIDRIWFDGIGFLEVKKADIPDIGVMINGNKLIVDGERDVITRPEVVKLISSILGHSWMTDVPVIEGFKSDIKLFWWETLEHYYKFRSDWDMYFEWLFPQINTDVGVTKFEVRFQRENNCLAMLRSGKIMEARQKYPNVVDQILKVA